MTPAAPIPLAAPLPIQPDAPWLAPLAGYSDLAFRVLCRELGAAVCCTEMISAKGLVFNSKGTRDLLRTLPEDAPLVAQLFGAEPDMLAQSAEMLLEMGIRFFDLNMGCSVPKVAKTGAGAALLKEPKAAVAAARALLRVTGPGSTGFKLRLGWNMGEESWAEIATELEQAGAAWLTLHPRFGRAGFSGRADWAKLRELKKLVKIPVIASGDLFTADDAARCLAETGVDAVMFARGALNNPAIFTELRERLRAPDAPPAPTDPAAVYARIKRHEELSLRFHGEHITMLKMRTFVPRSIRDIPGARAFRTMLVQCRTLAEADRLLDDFFSTGQRG